MANGGRMKVGYARISTGGQSLDSQVDALTAAGCERIFTETGSGAKRDRPVLQEVLAYLRPQDSLVVFKLDRAARSLSHLIALMEQLQRQQIGFKSLTEDIDTATSAGRLLFSIIAAIGEFERDLIVERTSAGLQAARARGRIGGRPRKLTQDKTVAALQLLAAGTPVRDVAAMLSVSVPTLYRWCPGTAR